MGKDGSTAEDTFYAKIRPHSLILRNKSQESCEKQETILADCFDRFWGKGLAEK